MTIYSPQTHPTIAIDLDDTIWVSSADHPANVDHHNIYPDAGVPFKWAIKTINAWITAGYEVIIWTARNNTEQATKCKKALLDAGINPNFKWNWYSNHSTSVFIQNKESSRKIDASIFFDDKAWGAPVYSEETWEAIYHDFFGTTDMDFGKTDVDKSSPLIDKPNPLDVLYSFLNEALNIKEYHILKRQNWLDPFKPLDIIVTKQTPIDSVYQMYLITKSIDAFTIDLHLSDNPDPDTMLFINPEVSVVRDTCETVLDYILN